MPVTDSLHIFLAEDNKADVRLIRIALDDKRSEPIRLSVASDGEAAIAFVKRVSTNASLDRPDLVILDLNLPKYSGAEVLMAIRENEYTKRLPVIMFSSAPEEMIKDKVHELGVEAKYYFTKPPELAEFLRLVKTFRDYALTARRETGV